MGDVYRARDLRLGRDVALKVLDPLLAFDSEYRRRFEDEAKSASGLNHPNIVTIYGVGEEADLTFITMELVHGRTLREHLSGRAMPIRPTLDIAVQLTSALAAAHLVGIVHRDLKPENVMVTTEGLVKVLDFGIAKRQFPHVVSDDDAGSPTIRTGETEGSTIVGTVGYMSPEQALGLPAGPASDQFSLGAILYEMVAGRRAFHRDSRVETVRAIVDAAPEPVHHLTRAVPHSPPARDRAVPGQGSRRSLRRHPGSRPRASADSRRPQRRGHAPGMAVTRGRRGRRADGRDHVGALAAPYSCGASVRQHCEG